MLFKESDVDLEVFFKGSDVHLEVFVKGSEIHLEVFFKESDVHSDVYLHTAKCIHNSKSEWENQMFELMKWRKHSKHLPKSDNGVFYKGVIDHNLLTLQKKVLRRSRLGKGQVRT